MFRRAAYLMFALFHFDEKYIRQCCEFGKWIAEYQYRSYINLTYAEQKDERKKWQDKKAPTTQATQEDFNKKMFEQMPNVFTKEDVFISGGKETKKDFMEQTSTLKYYPTNIRMIVIARLSSHVGRRLD